MPQVELNDKIFEAAQRRAAAGGYSKVEDYISDVVAQDLSDEAANFDAFFTPDRIAELERISDEISAGGKTYSMQEVQQHFEDRRKACKGNQAT